jgi:hypothetical protein
MGPSVQLSGFYNVKSWSFRQARRTMAGKFELRARDVRGASARFVFGMANLAQRAIQAQYSPSGLLQLAPLGP